MRIYKHKRFSQWAKSEKISDFVLYQAVKELVDGLYDANLGSGLYKKRIARKGRGKRGGYRTLLAYKENDRVIFVYGFAKNEKDNITDNERKFLKALAGDYLQASIQQIKVLVKNKELKELNYEE